MAVMALPCLGRGQSQNFHIQCPPGAPLELKPWANLQLYNYASFSLALMESDSVFNSMETLMENISFIYFSFGFNNKSKNTGSNIAIFLGIIFLFVCLITVQMSVGEKENEQKFELQLILFGP